MHIAGKIFLGLGAVMFVIGGIMTITGGDTCLLYTSDAADE